MSSQNDKIQDLAPAADDHDYCLSVMELEGGGGGKRNLEEINDLLLLTPSKGDHPRKIARPSPTASHILVAIQALHVRFDKQDDKMADINNKLSENASLIASLAESIEFNATEVRDCKHKITGLEKEASTLRREVDDLKKKARERDRAYTEMEYGRSPKRLRFVRVKKSVLTKEDRMEREKVWPKILQARNAGEKAYYRGAVGYINGRHVLADG
uniref:Uncharacterized protein n=1 Tax=Nothobranchius furzeri TaxID=105023 RepID=A0A1A8ACU6_NOTFU